MSTETKNPFTPRVLSDIPNQEGFPLVLHMKWGSWLPCTVRKGANDLHYLELDSTKEHVCLSNATGWHAR